MPLFFHRSGWTFFPRVGMAQAAMIKSKQADDCARLTPNVQVLTLLSLQVLRDMIDQSSDVNTVSDASEQAPCAAALEKK